MGLCGVHVLTAMVDGRDKEAFQSMYGREGLKALSMHVHAIWLCVVARKARTTGRKVREVPLQLQCVSGRLRCHVA